jgi:hypothetical protein
MVSYDSVKRADLSNTSVLGMLSDRPDNEPIFGTVFGVCQTLTYMVRTMFLSVLCAQDEQRSGTRWVLRIVLMIHHTPHGLLGIIRPEAISRELKRAVRVVWTQVRWRDQDTTAGS